MTSPLLLLQQVLPQVADTLATAAAPEPVEVGFMEMLFKGGWVMWPILLLSLAAIAVFVERLLTLNRSKADAEGIVDRVRAYVQSGDVRGALAYCAAQDKPVTRVLQAGLERLGRPILEIRDAVQTAGREETFGLARRTDLLASVAAIAPMLGFLGTVTGMIKTFIQIQNLQGNVNPSVLAGGIWEALLTTAAGLIAGIIALLLYNVLQGRIKYQAHRLEQAAEAFVDLMQEPAEATPAAFRSY